ncbi:MAG: acyltransferase family protein [Actinobacteria bacterium]|nr:MAG: acyltransferase family protein [Actinomycetota bacterium]RIK07561.1 MAG: hypothetical protein DCC48_03420 [Acidobacteriota bacterium]
MTKPGRIPYFPALDSMRGLGVLWVMAYHADQPGFSGAFLALSMFFTLSGFLITSLLLAERRDSGTNSLKGFWSRRMRRLMPAAFLGIAFILLYAVLAPATDGQLRTLRGDGLATLFYVANWRFIFSGQSYADLFAEPSPFQHFWSLAVEEQFYMLFPLLVVGVLVLFRSRRQVLAGILALMAAASAVWMVVLYDGGASFDRVYMGTDTRAAELLMGCLLGLLVAGRGVVKGRWTKPLVNAAGVAALATMIVLWHKAGIKDPFFYQGGLFLYALLMVILVVAATQPTGAVPAVLAGRYRWAERFDTDPSSFPAPVRPVLWLLVRAGRTLVWIGLLSYGLYIFHWPMNMWLSEAHLGFGGLPLLLVRFSATFALATVSFYLIERPIRTRRRLLGPIRFAAVPAASALLVVAILAATMNPPAPDLVFAEADEEPPDSEEVIDAGDAGIIGDPAASTSIALREPSVDDPVEVLVVGAVDDTDLTRGLGDYAERTGLVRVETLSLPPCDATIDPETRTCGSWTDLASDISGRGPDLVLVSSLLSVDDVLPADGDGSAAISAAVEVISGQAPLIWVPSDPAEVSTQPPVAATAEAVLREAASEGRLTGIPVPYDALAADTESYGNRPTALGNWVGGRLLTIGVGRRQPAEARKVMMVGDSITYSLAPGVADWGRRSGEAQVWNYAELGCGLGRGGEVIFADGAQPSREECGKWAELWPPALADFEPDVVYIETGPWDLVERKLDGWDDFYGPGDEVFDEWLLGEYQTAIDILARSDAEIVWGQAPCADPETYNGLLTGTVALEEATIDYHNEVLLPELVAANPGLRLLDVDDHVCPDGEYQAQLGPFTNARPDGLHYSIEAGTWVAAWIGPQLMEPAG